MGIPGDSLGDRLREPYPNMDKKFQAMERRAELQQLKETVVSSAKEWRERSLGISNSTLTNENKLEALILATVPLKKIVEELIAFEAKEE